MNCRLLGSPVHGKNFPDKNTTLGCHFLLQRIFLTQESNSHLMHWQVDSLLQSHLESPFTILPSSISAWGVDGRHCEQVDKLVHEKDLP